MEITMVPEALIDKVAETLETSESAFQEAISALGDEQPALLSYFFSEDMEAFTQEEKDYLLFLTVVIWRSVLQSGLTPPQVSPDDLTEAEEENWDMLQAISSPRFRERLDPFFLSTPQEDLLAFIEDALLDDEDSPVTKEGREAMFVTLKTVVDVLTGKNG
jgi:hypothetical protein